MSDVIVEENTVLVECPESAITEIEVFEKIEILTDAGETVTVIGPEIVVVESDEIKPVLVEIGVPAPSTSIHKMLWSSTQW